MDWRLPDGVDRMEVNAALTTLTERWDAHAANLVVYSFRTLPSCSPRKSYTRYSFTRRGSNVSGLTPQHGNVDIGSERETMYREHGYAAPDKCARVGQFKVERRDLGGSMLHLIFREFMDNLVDPPPPYWCLTYRIRDLGVVALVRYDPEPAPPTWRDHLYYAWLGLRLGVRFKMTKWNRIPTIIYIAGQCTLR